MIVGRRTFSAALANAIDFRKDTNAILVGEPIGERPNSYSENDEMTLPNSRLVVSYSTRYYKFVDEDVPAVLPDVRIDPSWPEFRAGRDPVMDWILAHDRSAMRLVRKRVPADYVQVDLNEVAVTRDDGKRRAGLRTPYIQQSYRD